HTRCLSDWSSDVCSSDLWGSRPNTLRASSPLHRCYQGEVWGVDMYQVLQRSRITLNSHIDMAGNEAGNVRLFESTGVGTFLLTEIGRASCRERECVCGCC